MNFDWDQSKYEMNHRKHKVRFEEAQTVFSDPRSLEFFDDSNSDSEDRFIRVGLSELLNVLLVVYCEKSESLIRIISARKATMNERKLYEKGI